MKRILTITLAMLLLVSLFSGISISAAETVLFEDDFESYEDGTVIDTKNSKYDVVTKNDKNEAWGIVESDDAGNKHLKFTITAEGKTGPRVVKYIDITGLKDITIAARVKTTGGVSNSIQLYTDGALNATLSCTNKDAWSEVKHELNFETLTFISYKDGKELTRGELKPITDKSKLDIRFFQTIDNTKCTYWDDIMITTSGEKSDESAVPAPKPEEPKAEEPKPETPAIAPSTAQKAPLIAGPNGEKVVILKFDDLGAKGYNGFKTVYEYCKANGVHIAFGAIGDSSEALSAEQWAEIKTWTENGVEIWHHGAYHSINRNVDPYVADFQGKTAEEYIKNIKSVVDLYAAHGIEITSVGAPYNLNDDLFLDTLNKEFPNITSVMYGKDAKKIFNGYILGNRINIESGTGTPSLDTLKTSYAKAANYNYMVIQMHPGSYTDEAKLSEMVASIEYLKEQGCIFMTPTEYVNYCMEAANKPAEKKVIEVIDETAIGGKIRVVYDNKDIDFAKYDSVYPVIENGRTLIPIRALSETIGATVGWEDATQKITITQDDTVIIMFLDNPNATVNGESVTLDAPPATRSDRTMVPLRFASESLGLEVKWTQK